MILPTLLIALFVLTPLTSCKKSDGDGATTTKMDHVYKQSSIALPEELTSADNLFFADGKLYLLSTLYEEITPDEPDSSAPADNGDASIMPREEGSDSSEEDPDDDSAAVSEEPADDFANEKYDGYTTKITLVLYTVNLDGSDGTLQTILTLPENSYISGMVMNSDQTISYIENVSTYDSDTDYYEEQYTLKKIDLNGKELASTKLFSNNNETEDPFYIQYFQGDAEGNLYLGSDRKVFVYDSNATQLYSVEINGSLSKLAKDSNGTVLAFWQDDTEYKTTVQKFDNAAKKLGEEYKLSEEAARYSYNMFSGEGYSLYYDNGSSIMGYDIDSEKSTELLNWINSDIDTSSIDTSRIVVASDKQFFLISYGMETGKPELIKLDWVDPKDIKEKKLITLAASFLDYNVRMAVVNFNKTSEEYRITVKDYSTYNTEDDYNRATTMLNSDIASGNIPDILLVSSDMPFDSYAAKGLFADLNAFFDKDNTLKREDYLKNVFDAATVDGKLYSLIPSFSIYTLVGKSKFVGTEPGWTMDDLNTLIDKMPEDTMLFYDMTRDNLLQLSCMMAKNQFIDSKTGKCSFDSPEFVKLLEFTNTFSNESIWDNIDWDDVDDSFWQDMETACRDDRALLQMTSLYSFESYWELKKMTFGDDITLVGFPTESKEGSLITSSIELAMSAKSKNQDGAWQFMKYFLSDEYQDTISYEWPVKRSQIDALAESAMKEQEAGSDDLIAYAKGYASDSVAYSEIGRIDQTSVDEVKQFLQSVNQVMRYDQSILEIIQEETSTYYAGQKTADETAKIIQNRVQTYVSENR